MPKFLTTDEVYRLIQRELPNPAYPDGSPTGYFSTADSYATAKTIGNAYCSQKNIYANYSPLSATGNLPDFELMYLGRQLDVSLGIDARRSRVVTQARSQRRPTLQDLEDVVHTIIDPSIVIKAIKWNSPEGSWMIGESELGVGTYLSGARLVDATGPNLCSANPSDFGLTPDEWIAAQEQAYTYELRIYDYTPTALEMTEINNALNQAESARSRHLIVLATTGNA